MPTEGDAKMTAAPPAVTDSSRAAVLASRAKALALSCHPGPVVGVTAAATAYAAVLGRSPAGTASVAAAVLAGQLSVGWHNDWLDSPRDLAASRTDKPVALGLIAVSTVRMAALVAAAACVPLSLLSGWRAALVHLVAVAVAWGYNAGLKAGWASFAPYGVAFGLLPVFVSLGARGAPLGPWWAPAAAMLLGVGAHFMNALPDLDDDEAAGIRGLPHRIGRTASLRVAAVFLLAASLVLVLHSGRPSVAGLIGLGAAIALVAGAVASARSKRSRAPFNLAIAVALVDVALLLIEGHGAI